MRQMGGGGGEGKVDKERRENGVKVLLDRVLRDYRRAKTSYGNRRARAVPGPRNAAAGCRVARTLKSLI